MIPDRWREAWAEFRPLDRIGSIKLKLGLTIVLGVFVSSAVAVVGLRWHWPVWVRLSISMVIALALVQVLTRGMTSPLREMAAAARHMAEGHWRGRVTDTSADEVGELARAFNAMADELAVVDRMRKDLIANVSHELRTPISALQARLENLVDGVEAPDPALLRSMLDQTERLGRLVAQLLDLSRLESGAVPLRRELLEVAPLLEAVADEARLQAPGRRIETSVEPPDLAVLADPDRVHQVLANLTDNALRHGPTDRPVRLAAGTADRHVVLTVTDEGPGISDAEVERVFERFYRLDQARVRNESGTGLGLSIARHVAGSHGGEVSLDSVEGQGTTCTLRLPAGPAPVALTSELAG